MTNKSQPVGHFEIPGDDMDRMKKFYQEAFNWKIQQLGDDYSNYVVVQTTDTDEQGMVRTPGTINGGFFKRTEDTLSQHPSVVVMVDDIKEASEKITAAGGKVIGGKFKKGEPDDIPHVGLWSAVVDSEGNRISILQPKR